MKVPIMYKSSDRFNAGTDVIYDDDSKLQYAPFIYAGVTAKDNGDDGGDEEGEDTMLVIYDSTTGAIDKSYKDLKDAVNAGKIVWLSVIDDESGYALGVYYLVALEHETEGDYYAQFGTVYGDGSPIETSPFIMKFEAESDTVNMSTTE